MILFAGSAPRFRLTNSFINCDCTAAAVDMTTAAVVDLYIENVRLLQSETAAGLGIAAHNSSTGLVQDIVVVNLKNGVAGVTGTGLSVGPNVVYSNAVNAYAGLFTTTIDS